MNVSSHAADPMWLAREREHTEAMALRSVAVVFSVLVTLLVFVAWQRRRLEQADVLKHGNAVRKAQFERVSNAMKKHAKKPEVELVPLLDDEFDAFDADTDHECS
ncbi:hypothetical protein ACHHYP_14807 [Achlya hypogyna]|uniref:Transmembrane protein n=1 Tax=Achlya hypogyna TaxID=1202772 RepID=A0A1V9YC86_ACHHY|nr:hypothetical protein ACHHYP_14807 [Achlya hypogyna]